MVRQIKCVGVEDSGEDETQMIISLFGSCNAPKISEALVLIVLVTIVEEDLILPERVQRPQGLVLEVEVEAAKLVQGLDSAKPVMADL